MQAAIQWLLYWRRTKKNLIELRKRKRDDLNNLFLRKGLPGRLWSPLMCELSGLGWSKNTGSLQRRAAGLYKPHGLSDRLFFFFFLPRVNHSHIQSETTSINLNPLLCVCHVTLFPSRHTQWERAWSWLSGPDVSFMFVITTEEPCWSSIAFSPISYTHSESCILQTIFCPPLLQKRQRKK